MSPDNRGSTVSKLTNKCSSPEFLVASGKYKLKVKLACSIGKQNF